METNEKIKSRSTEYKNLLSDTCDFETTIGYAKVVVYAIYESEKNIYFNMDMNIKGLVLHLRSMSISKKSKKLYFPKNGNSNYSAYYFDKEDIDTVGKALFPEVYNA